MVNTRYRIESALGTGGSGAVYKAFDLFEGRPVAMKRLASEKLPTAADLQRAQSLFEREYYVLAELAHPKIVEVYDYGVDDDGSYYTMEWLPGTSLRQRSPLPFATACSFVRDIASSLAMLHSRRLVHRDVTPQNIYCFDDGTAKLIDFGAMTPIGVPKLVVGTPPFMAPECVDFQVVDGRTDLFSLGACLYYALTGRHAYAAQSIRELHAVWQHPVVWPSRFAPEIPESLDRLILELLSLRAAGRPSSAAEVFERLTTIAGLDAGEAPTVARGYLQRPALAGRRDKLARVVRRTLRAARGKGSSVVVVGPSGVGRSRFLEAAMLEAKVAGFTVLHTDTPAGRVEPFAAMRSVAQALGEVAPDAARVLATSGKGEDASTGQGRDDAIRAVAAAIGEVTSTRSVALAVDDAHLVDGESLAVLALLSATTDRARLLLIATIDADEAPRNDPGLALLRSSSTEIALGPLAQSETRALLSSLFGDVPNLDTVCSLLHAGTQGNPRELLDAAQRLVDDGLAVYAGGAWMLSSDPDAIGRVLARNADVARQVERLTADARVLASMLALDRDAIMALADYPGLAFDGDRARSNKALTELLGSGLVTLVEDKCRFGRDAYRTALAAALGDAERRAIHGRLAARASQFANAIYPAFHHFHANELSLAAESLRRFAAFVDAHPGDTALRRPIVLDTVEQILGSDGDFGAAFRAEHGAGLVINAVYRGLPERAAPHAAHYLRQMSWLSGLDEYHARTDLPPGERLGMAFSLAQERCTETGPIQTLRRFCQLALMTTICARFMADPSLLSALPDLSPFRMLSPAVAFTIRFIEAMSHVTRGKDLDAKDAFRRICTDLRGPDGEGVDAVTRLALGQAALAQLVALEAEYATTDALEHIDELASLSPNLGESSRARYYMACGMAHEAEAARQLCERLSLQTASVVETRNAELFVYLALQAISNDVQGLKRTHAAMNAVFKTRPGWKGRVALARAHLLRCRENYAEALATIDATLETLPVDCPEWAPAAALRVSLLDLKGDTRRAIEVGVAYLDVASAHRLPFAGIALALALALARTDAAEKAEEHVTLALSALETRGAAGVQLGWYFELAARVASLRGDRTAFAERAERCATLYRYGENPILTARYDALVRADRVVQARSRSGPLDQTATIVVGKHQPQDSEFSVDTCALSSIESDARADALALLVERAGARGGFLYGLSEGKWRRLCATPGLEAPEELDATVIERLPTGDGTSTSMSSSACSGVWSTPWELEAADGERLIPCLLSAEGSQVEQIVGVAVLAVPEESSVQIPATSLAAAARVLLSNASPAC